jgi:hypothetical protein
LHSGQREPSRSVPPLQLKHETSTSTLGSVKGKKWGRSSTSRCSPKIWRANASSVPLRSASVTPVVDRQAFDLVKLRRVRGVVVGPVDAARGNDVKRRRLGDHRAHLDRRRVHTQDRVVVDVEGVAACARGVRQVRVERVEVVFGQLDLRSLGDLEAEAEEDVLDVAAGLGDQVQMAVG